MNGDRIRGEIGARYLRPDTRETIVAETISACEEIN